MTFNDVHPENARVFIFVNCRDNVILFKFSQLWYLQNGLYQQLTL